MTQSQWRDWGKQRVSDADRIAREYKRQGEKAQKLAGDYGCPCDPIIAVGSNPAGPVFTNPHITHALDCDRG